MKKIFLSILSIIWILAGACNKVVKKVNYCGFNSIELVPDSNCINGIRITTDYINDELNSLNFYSQNKLVKRDTVITLDNNIFYISQSNLLLNNIIRVSTKLNDTTKTFVFYKRIYGYELAMLESNYTDSSIKIELFINSGFRTNLIRRTTVDSLRNYLKYATPLPFDYLMVNYFYNDNVLQYKMLEAHSNLRGLGGQDYYNKISNPYHCIYLDIELIQDSSTLEIYKQINGLWN